MTAILPLLAALAVQPQTQDTVPLYDDLGDHHHAITTSSPRTQQYFDQGLRLMYGFNHAEAIASFREALRSDENCAMCWWGVAHAYGPNINAAMDSAGGAAAWEAAQNAQRLAHGTTPIEQAFIGAVVKRYGPGPMADRTQRDSAFAHAMAGVYRAHPDDDDAAALYAESLMDLSPWIYWTPEREMRAGTREMIDALEKVNARNVKHAGSCHLYIHAVEAAYPKRAEVCADRLAALMPGAGHIVHMPGHIYVRVGRWADAIEANKHAIHEDETFIADRRPEGVYPLGYYPHNIHFLNFAATMAASEELALQSATDLAAKSTLELQRMPGLAGFSQHYALAPAFASLRFEKWDDVLAMPVPPADLTYANGLARYARGVAFARKGDVARADAELAELQKLAAVPALKELNILSYNNGAAILDIARHTLLGEVAAARKEWAVAAGHLTQAAALEDALIYIEPPEWLIPSNQTLGRVHLLAGQPADAQRAFEADLERFPENVWSLRGLAESLEKQGKMTEARAVQARIEKAMGTGGASHRH